mgnify:CR=1 FL=1
MSNKLNHSMSLAKPDPVDISNKQKIAHGNCNKLLTERICGRQNIRHTIMLTMIKTMYCHWEENHVFPLSCCQLSVVSKIEIFSFGTIELCTMHADHFNQKFMEESKLLWRLSPILIICALGHAP